MLRVYAVEEMLWNYNVIIWWFQKYEDFDESYCDHENHHHSIFDEILEELPDDKYVLIGIEKNNM